MAEIIILVTPKKQKHNGDGDGDHHEEFRVELFENGMHHDDFKTICRAFGQAEVFQTIGEAADYANYLTLLHQDRREARNEYPAKQIISFNRPYEI